MRLELLLAIIVTLLFNESTMATSSWIQRADFGSVGRHRGMGIAIGNKGYMGLGHYNGAGPNIILKDWWQFDPSTNSWTQKADYVGNNGNGNYAVLSFGMEKHGFVGGGQIGSSTEFYKYDPLTNNWSQAANLPTVAMNTEGFVIGTKGYYMDGSSVYEYDAQLDVWTTKNNAPFSISIWPATFTVDGKGYVKTSSSFWEYKPASDQWIARAPFPGLSTGGAVGFHQSNKGYIVSGYAGSLGNVNSETWEFNPATNTWLAQTEFYGSSRRFSSGFTIGNKAYIGTGTNGTNFNDFWEFDALAGLSEMFDPNKFKCFPNPATNFVNFQSENLSDFQVQVFNLKGELLNHSETQSNSLRITRNNLTSGTYIYKVVSEGKTVYSNKLIFQ